MMSACAGGGTGDTYADISAHGRCRARKVLARLDGHPEPAVDVREVGATKEGAGTKEREGVVRCTCVVNSDIPHHVFIDLLRQVDVDAQKVR
jgi:hypothetical protein